MTAGACQSFINKKPIQCGLDAVSLSEILSPASQHRQCHVQAMDWSFEQQQEGSVTESSQQEHSGPFLTGKPCGATYWLSPSRGVGTEHPVVSLLGVVTSGAVRCPSGPVQEHLVPSLGWQTLGNINAHCASRRQFFRHPLHADRVDSCCRLHVTGMRGRRDGVLAKGS